MYQVAYNSLVITLLLAVISAVVVWSWAHFKKSSAVTTVSLGVQTGDAESMNFSTNFTSLQSPSERQAALVELYNTVAARREENHRKFEEVKAKAIAANEARATLEAESNVSGIKDKKNKS